MRDLLAPGLDIVFCGTAKGHISARTGSFYANPSNRFYRTLFEAGLTPVQVAAKDFHKLLDHGIGLTDLNQSESGMDRALTRQAFDIVAFEEKMRWFRPKLIAFTSLAAARIYFGNGGIACGPQPHTLDGMAIFVLPSTSGANGHWTKDRHHWYQLPGLI